MSLHEALTENPTDQAIKVDVDYLNLKVDEDTVLREHSRKYAPKLRERIFDIILVSAVGIGIYYEPELQNFFRFILHK